MEIALLALSYEELKARRDALRAAICAPLKDATCTILIHDDRIPALGELEQALAILADARRRLAVGPKGEI
jgi:hypothetical protein